MIYGKLPDDLGLVDISPTEMMFWLYCPILTPSSLFTVPANLKQFEPIVQTVIDDCWARDDHYLDDKYVYLTAKTLWVTPPNPGNRPGWHSDGFGSDDINYIWYDRAPTEFLHVKHGVELPTDCDESMRVMEMLAGNRVIPHNTYPVKHLLRLDQSVIHRTPAEFEDGIRTFVKVSISKDRYNLVGNSVNHGLAERWDMHERQLERNHPCTHDTNDRSQQV